MKPELLLCAQLGECGEIVGSAAVHRARSADHADRPAAGERVGRDHVAQRVNANSKSGIDRYAAQ